MVSFCGRQVTSDDDQARLDYLDLFSYYGSRGQRFFELGKTASSAKVRALAGTGSHVVDLVADSSFYGRPQPVVPTSRTDLDVLVERHRRAHTFCRLAVSADSWRLDLSEMPTRRR